MLPLRLHAKKFILENSQDTLKSNSTFYFTETYKKESIVHVTKLHIANVKKTATQMPNKVEVLHCWHVFKIHSLELSITLYKTQLRMRVFLSVVTLPNTYFPKF